MRSGTAAFSSSNSGRFKVLLNDVFCCYLPVRFLLHERRRPRAGREHEEEDSPLANIDFEQEKCTAAVFSFSLSSPPFFLRRNKCSLIVIIFEAFSNIFKFFVQF
jgi:hypothetical protein